MTGRLDQHVFRLEVAVGDPHRVEVVEGADDLGQVKTDDGLRENVIVLFITEDVEVTAWAVRYCPGEEVVGVEGSEEGGEERVGVRAG